MLNINIICGRGQPVDLKDIRLQIQPATILGVQVRKKALKEAFVETLGGMRDFEGDILLNKMSLKESLKSFKGQVDIIRNDGLDSKLNVSEYLVFYGMARGIYHSQYHEKMDRLLTQTQMMDVKQEQMNMLSRIERYMIRSIAAYLKNSKLCVYDSILEDLSENEQRRFMAMMRHYIQDHEAFGVVVETQPVELSRYTDTVYNLL